MPLRTSFLHPVTTPIVGEGWFPTYRQLKFLGPSSSCGKKGKSEEHTGVTGDILASKDCVFTGQEAIA